MRAEHANIIFFKDILKSKENGETEMGMTYEDAAKDLSVRTAGYVYRHQGNQLSELVTDVLRSDSQLARDLIGFAIQAMADDEG